MRQALFRFLSRPWVARIEQHLLQWLLFVGRLIIGYAVVGALGGLIGTVAIAAYAYPGDAACFALGVGTTCAVALARRAYRRHIQREGFSPALVARFHRLISDDFGHHNRRAA